MPIDEHHPMINFDPYGLSKEVDERTAAVMARRFSMSVAALRFHWIATRDQQLAGIARQRRGPRDRADELRSTWGYVDLRDAASACRLAIEAAADRPYGFVPMNIVAADSLVETPSTDLLAEHAPEIEVRAHARSHPGGVRHRPRRRGDRLDPAALLARSGLRRSGLSRSGPRRLIRPAGPPAHDVPGGLVGCRGRRRGAVRWRTDASLPVTTRQTAVV